MRALQGLLWVSGSAVLAWALTEPRFRDSDWFLKAGFCLPFSAGVALLLLGGGLAGNLAKSAGWLALALVGQAAALQLIEAGTLVRWQRYKPLGRMLAETHPIAFFFIFAQAVLVFAALRSRWQRIRSWARGHFAAWQLIGIASVFVLSSSSGQRVLAQYVQDLILAASLQALNLANVILIVWDLPDQALGRLRQRLERWLGPAGEPDAEPAKRERRLPLLAAAWVMLLAALLGFFSYQWFPHITDEVVHLFQARVLARGAVTLPAPPVPDAFEIYLMESEGNRWYGVTPPGWPAILAIGVRLGVPALVNPLLAALNTLLGYRLLRLLYDRRTATIAVVLLAASPWYVFMAMNFMNHTFALTCALVCGIATIRAHRTSRASWALLAGLGVGAASLIRPLDGVILALLVAPWLVRAGGRRLSISSVGAFAVGALLIGGIAFPYNQWLTGSPTQFPVNAYLDRHFEPGRNAMGFGPRGYGWSTLAFPVHSPLTAMINANLNTFSINVELFGWSIGSLLIVALVLFAGPRRRADHLMLSVCLAIFAAYFFYYYSGGPDFAARYWFMMLVPLVALTASGVDALRQRLDGSQGGSPLAATRATAAVFVLSLMALINYFPWRATDKYRHYWGMRPDVDRLAKERSFGRSLVLVQAKGSHPDYSSAAVFNPLDWKADAPIYAWDRNPAIRTQLLQAFSDRPVWIVQAPSFTSDGYRVIAGPLTAAALLAQERPTQSPNRLTP